MNLLSPCPSQPSPPPAPPSSPLQMLIRSDSDPICSAIVLCLLYSSTLRRIPACTITYLRVFSEPCRTSSCFDLARPDPSRPHQLRTPQSAIPIWRALSALPSAFVITIRAGQAPSMHARPVVLPSRAWAPRLIRPACRDGRAPTALPVLSSDNNKGFRSRRRGRQ